MSRLIKSKRKNFILAGVAVFILFLVMSYLVNKDVFRSVDYDVMVGIQQIISRNLDFYLSLFTIVGSSEITIPVLAAIFILIFIKSKNLFLGTVFFFLAFIIELAGKFYIYHPKPPIIFFRNVINLHLPSGFIVDTRFSYPSGHMTRVIYILTLLFIFTRVSAMKRRSKYAVSILIIMLSAVVFISRIYLGEHWLTDVVGGSLLGISLGLLSLAFW